MCIVGGWWKLLNATFQINSAKLYDVPVVTLSKNDNKKYLEHLKQEFKRKFLGINIDLR